MSRPGQERSYDGSENRGLVDRFQTAAAVVDRRALKRAHSLKQSLTILRRGSARDAVGTSATPSTDLIDQAIGRLLRIPGSNKEARRSGPVSAQGLSGLFATGYPAHRTQAQ
jgi:hypothetical protein